MKKSPLVARETGLYKSDTDGTPTGIFFRNRVIVCLE